MHFSSWDSSGSASFCSGPICAYASPVADRVQRGPAVPAIGRESVTAQVSVALKAVCLGYDFRHSLGSTVIRHADSREVMEWMGHADLIIRRSKVRVQPAHPL